MAETQTELSETKAEALSRIGIEWDDKKKSYFYGGKLDDKDNIIDAIPIERSKAEELASKALALEEQAKNSTNQPAIDIEILLAQSGHEKDSNGNYFDKDGKIIPPEDLLKRAKGEVANHTLDNGANYADNQGAINNVPTIDESHESSLEINDSKQKKFNDVLGTVAQIGLAMFAVSRVKYVKGAEGEKENPDNATVFPIYSIDKGSDKECNTSKKIEMLEKANYSPEQINNIINEYNAKYCVSKSDLGFFTPDTKGDKGLSGGIGFKMNF